MLRTENMDLLNSMFSTLSTGLLPCSAYKFGESPTGVKANGRLAVTRNDIAVIYQHVARQFIFEKV